MKVCPECANLFTSDFLYCLNDGMTLIDQEAGLSVDFGVADVITQPRIDWKHIDTLAVFRPEVEPSQAFGEYHDTKYSPQGDTELEKGPDSSNSFCSNSTVPPTFANPPVDFPVPKDATEKPFSRSRSENKKGSSIFEPGKLVFDQFRVENKLAKGGFGEIYLVKDESDFLKQSIVLKVIPKSMFSHMKSPQRTYKTWRVISEYYPDKIVRLLNVRQDLVVDDEPVLCLFMEFMEGGSLQELIEVWRVADNPISPSQINQLLIFFKQVCESVYVLHKENLLHRDIKPGNVLFNRKKDKCKLCDFEIMHDLQSGEPPMAAGTPYFLAPEAPQHPDVASDIFSLGATFYFCLTGSIAYQVKGLDTKSWSILGAPKSLLEFNSLIPPELDQLILRCLEINPGNRPASVKEILRDLNRIGTFEAGEIKQQPLSSSAPLILSKCLVHILSKDDLDFLVKSLKRFGYRSKRDAEHGELDLIEEYCYSVEPDKILKDNMTKRQLFELADILEIKPNEFTGRDDLIQKLLLEMGFRRGLRTVPGLGAIKLFIENSMNNFSNATTSDECQGMIQSAFSSIEIGVDLLIRFYGQIFHGSSFETILSRHANGKPKASRWTFGEKTKILRSLIDSDISPLPERTKLALKQGFFDERVFGLLEKLSKTRNSLAHQSELKSFSELRTIGQDFLEVALDTMRLITESKNVPRAVQIVSIEYDVFGRHFYRAIDDRGRKEKIFHSLPLELGEIYLFFPLTNPARINPIIVPYEYDKKAK